MCTYPSNTRFLGLMDSPDPSTQMVSELSQPFFNYMLITNRQNDDRAQNRSVGTGHLYYKCDAA